MKNSSASGAVILGAFLCAGLTILGYLVAGGLAGIRMPVRTVTVKGLAEREVVANRAIWPMTIVRTDNKLNNLYKGLEKDLTQVATFLKTNGFSDKEITISAPTIVDKQAQGYGDTSKLKYRYFARQSVTVFSNKVDAVRRTMKKLVELGKAGIVFGGDQYENRAEFVFTDLNAIKPEMIQEAIANAGKVAEKFARHTDSRLGRIKRANQGLFTITNRDRNTTWIKKVRVVTTITYLRLGRLRKQQKRALPKITTKPSRAIFPPVEQGSAQRR